ncbi:glycoside hydrolase superfamily, partial [Fusarium oxysporum]
LTTDADSKLAANHTRFPGGISPTASYVHSKGLKVGIYSDDGIFTCGKYPGGHGYEEIDAQTFADWGVDYLKYDNCGGFQSNTLSVQERFLKMTYSLAASGRQIFYSLCEWGNQFTWLWADQIGESYRMLGDIYSSFAKDRASICKTAYCMNQGYAGVSVMTMIRKMREISPFSKPGAWDKCIPDMDMLGIGTWTMTELEEQTHFSFWAALKSPLIIGADLHNIGDTSLAIYKNREVIALNQDDAGQAAVYLPKLSEEGSYQVWAGPLSSGKRRHVNLAQNYGSEDVDVEISLGDILDLSMEQQWKIRGVWARKEIAASGGKVSLKGLKPMQTKVLVISK